MGYGWVEVKGAAGDGEGWGDDGADHCEGVLEAEEEGEEDGDLVVEAVEGCDVVFIFAVERPDVWGYEVHVILRFVLEDFGLNERGWGWGMYIIANPTFTAGEVVL